MQFTIATVLALAASAFAAPTEQYNYGETCKFGTYRCTGDISGIEICNVQGYWELVGPCPSGTSCEFLPQNGFELPFCTANPTPKAETAPVKRQAGSHCPTPGQYYCAGLGAIQVCDTQNQLQPVGSCPENSHCSYLNGIPFCVA